MRPVLVMVTLLLTLAAAAGQTVGDSSPASFVGYQVLKVSVTNSSTVDLLRSYEDMPGVDFWTPPSELVSTVDVMVSPDVRSNLTDQLTSNGATYTVSIDDVQTAVAEESRQISDSDREVLTGRQGHPLTWTAYHRLADHHQYLEYVAQAHPQLCATFSIGTSSEGRDLKVIKCGYGTREIWIDGGIHAREWISPAVTSYLIKEFSENSRSQDILQKFTVYILPVLNPDGYEYTHTNSRFWRKTRSRSPISHCRGVDPNRNFDIRWGVTGTSKRPCSNIYGGPRPFSEPETRAVRNFLLRHADNMEMYISFHSYGQMLFVPYGFSLERPADYSELLRVARLGASAIRRAGGPPYQVGQAPRLLYASSGDSQDWAKAVAGIKYSLTFELRDTGRHGFLLPATLIQQSGAEIAAGVQTMIRAIA